MYTNIKENVKFAGKKLKGMEEETFYQEWYNSMKIYYTECYKIMEIYYIEWYNRMKVHYIIHDKMLQTVAQYWFFFIILVIHIVVLIFCVIYWNETNNRDLDLEKLS